MNDRAKGYLAAADPVISVDTKKEELAGRWSAPPTAHKGIYPRTESQYSGYEPGLASRVYSHAGQVEQARNGPNLPFSLTSLP